MAFGLLSKKILVTGAGRGLGRQIAIALSKNGAEVYAVSRTDATLKTLKSDYPSIETITLDLSHWNETRNVLKQLDVMDGLVNNAAVIQTKRCDAVSTSYELLQSQMHNTLYSAINCTQVCAEKLVSSGKPGSIVNVSSIVSMKIVNGILAYSLAKSGLDMITKQFSVELGTYNIRVNSINPTLFLTEGSSRIEDFSAVVDYTLTRTPIKRLPEIKDVVGAVLFYLTDQSAMITGTSLLIDGGSEKCL